MERLDTSSRQFHDPITKDFNHGKKRVTDLEENSKIMLPKACNPLVQSSNELLSNKIMEMFRRFRDKNCKI